MKKIFLTGLILIIPLAFLTSCGESNVTDSKFYSADESNSKAYNVDESNSTSPVYGKMIDSRDNHVYETVVINGDTWMAENLSASTFLNGDKINHAQTKLEWSEYAETKTPAWCFVSLIDTTNSKYGKLYNWYAVSDTRNLAPSGWYIPSESEFNELIKYYGGEKSASDKMKANKLWIDYDYNTEEINSNESGLSIIPCGSIHCVNEAYLFNSFESLAVLWTSSELNQEKYPENDMASTIKIVSKDKVSFEFKDKANGYSIRCVKVK